jgi:hypothetical protein
MPVYCLLYICIGKRGAAVYIQAECSRTTDPQHLKELLSTLLNPQKPIDELETVDWIKWLVAGGKTPIEFASIGNYLLAFHHHVSYG